MIEHSTDNRVIAAMLALFNLRRALDEAERGNEPLVVVAIDDLRAILGEGEETVKRGTIMPIRIEPSP